MNVEQIRNFITIAKTKNITRTSEILFIAQSTVSHRLKALESELGCQLVSRQKGIKTAELTKRGEEFLPIAEQWIAIWQEAELFKGGIGDKRLNVGCVDSMVTCLLSDFFAAFIERHPHIRLRVVVANSDDMYKMLRSREIDVGITLLNYSYQNVGIRPILSEKMYCVHSFDEFLRGGRISPLDLNPKDEIMFKCGIEFELWHDFWFKAKPRSKVQVNTILLVEHYLRKGRVWSIVPETAANYIAERTRCAMLELDNSPPDRISYCITHAIAEPELKEAIAIFNREMDAYTNQYQSQHIS